MQQNVTHTDSDVNDHANNALLIDSVMYEDMNSFLSLLDQKVDPNAVSRHGSYALIEAVQKGASVMIDVLLKNKADVNITDASGNSAQMYACKNGQINVVYKFLQEAGISSQEGISSSLRVTCELGSQPIQKVLLGCTTEPLSYDFQVEQLDLALNGTHIAMQQWQQLGRKDSVICFDAQLWHACQQERVRLAKFLQSNGARTEFKWEDNSCTLFVAVESANVELVQQLQDHRAVVDCVDGQRCTPLFYAARLGFSEVLQLLVTYGAALDYRNCVGHSPLHCAVTDKRTEIVQQLLTAQADPNCVSLTGVTPQMLAALYGYRSVAQCLLDGNAAPNHCCRQGHNALFNASIHGHLSVTKQQASRGANVNAQFDGGKTVLHISAIKGKESMVDMLLRYKADASVPDSLGKTALHYSIELGPPRVVERILSMVSSTEIG